MDMETSGGRQTTGSGTLIYWTQDIFVSLGLEQGHGSTMHVHGFPWYEFMNLDMNRANIVWPCSETMTL